MSTAPAATTRRLFLASVVLFAFSLVFSVTNVVTVFSAPLRVVSVPTQVGFEGYLTDAFGAPLGGTHNLTFKLYSVATGGSSLWSETQNSITVTDGLYSVLLNGLPVSTFTGDRWLGVTVDTGTEISPRTRIGSVPFALNAQAAEEVAWSGVTGKPAGFADGADDVGTGVPGSGAAGRVSVWDSTTSVIGATGLLYANNTLTVTDNLAYSGSLVRNGATGYTYVPLASVWYATNFNFQGGAFTTGDHLVDVSTATGAPASTAHIKAYYVRLLVKWATAGDNIYAGLHEGNPANLTVGMRSLVANYYMEVDGIARPDANGDLRLRIGNANASNVYIAIWGYYQ